MRKRSVESIYFLYTYWRIKKQRKALKNLLDVIIDYIKTYFQDYNNDPDMKLFYPTEGLTTAKKLSIITHWLEHIAFHTNGIFEKYKTLNWLVPKDKLADNIISTNQISKYDMLKYKLIFSHDSNETIKQKAICYHGYFIWIKTTDIIVIVKEIARILYNSSLSELKSINATNNTMLELYDNLTKIYDYYVNTIYYHKVFYEESRKFLDSGISKAIEADAKKFEELAANVNTFVESIADNDIDSLLQSKQNYKNLLLGVTSNKQIQRFEELTFLIIERIKTTIQKSQIYNELYRAISKEFSSYSGLLLQYPQLFCSLVSAECLYQQYIKDAPPKDNFDYSFISIMYYRALEDFLNKLVYTPYYTEVLSKISNDVLNDGKPTKENKQHLSKYISDYHCFWDKKHKTFKETCELGSIGFLFDGILNEKFFKSFICDRYKKTDIQRIKNLGSKIKSVSPRRNEAAHGGNYIKYTDVIEAKSNVYDVSVEKFKGLILELMDIIY